ncbi:hypothetical protein BH24ACT6_BH24ACT6_14690 [soil metagenome]
MPWCEECAKYRTPTSMNDDGTCPTCGAGLEEPEIRPVGDEEDLRAPWHVKLMVVALVVYLVWRFWEILA